MATLALSLAGSALGAAVLPSVSVLGATVTGAAIGQAIGATAGAYVDRALFGASGQARVVEGPRLASIQVMSSNEGAPIPRLYGRARLGGQVIWATRFEEVATTTTEGEGGGKGLGGGGGSPAAVTRVDYRYFASFAVGLCEGPVTRIGRIWADGKELDLSGVTWRLHRGGEDQLPDSLIEAKEGPGLAPAYRGTAYVVFERLALERFGNRLPQLSFEVFRAVDGFEGSVRAVSIIPGAGEFAYATGEVVRRSDGGASEPENVHTFTGGTDWSVAIDQLQDSLPNVAAATLVVSWFGTDLRAGHCHLRPGVEAAGKATEPVTWKVAGQSRAEAYVVSSHGGRPAYGGTPSDDSVIGAIRDLKARGLAVTYSPFILMDVPAGNGLPDPHGAGEQAAYPWRGRITIHPAPGRPGSPDKTGDAAAQVASLVGSAQPAHFALSGEEVVYSGPDEWTLRRMVLHGAFLCKAAGGVDAFLIGSELRGLTTVRSGASAYPFVSALAVLAADVKAVLGPSTKVTYAADWSEFFGHQPADGSGDVHFHLDPLWSSAAIDAVGIDLYWPLADWRDGDSHLDRLAGAPSAYDLAYLKANVFAGEGFDWHYASPADRDAQVRTPITDGAGKPWVFRYKDIRNWWSQPHHDRPGGLEAGSPTAWVPQSKPIWLTEVGCPAVDKGANQPNVFSDPKSAESFLPYYSRGFRDDLVQRRYLQAVLETFDPTHPDFQPAANPVSALYGGHMVEPGRTTVYTWDARPYPAFPYARGVWADGGNWEIGHWLTGRVAGGSLAAVVAAILDDHGFTRYVASGLEGMLDGYVIDRPMSARQALQPLELAYFFDSCESAGTIRFSPRGRAGPVTALGIDDLVESGPAADVVQLTRGQDAELPGIVRVGFLDAGQEYRQSAVESRRLTGAARRVAGADLPLVMAPDAARRIAEAMLQDAWGARHRASLALPPSRRALEPGDLLALTVAGRRHDLRITGLSEAGALAVEARSLVSESYEATTPVARDGRAPLPAAFGAPSLAFLDLPLLRGDESPFAVRAAAFQTPWPGGIAFHRATGGGGFAAAGLLRQPATLGRLLAPLPPGPPGRWDRSSAALVEIEGGSLQSVDEAALLGGANTAAVERPDGSWEVVQFASASLVANRTYRLTGLLRDQAGSDRAVPVTLPSGARLVLLDEAVGSLAATADQIGLDVTWRYGPANRGIGHLSYRNATRPLRATGLRPLSPVHVRGRRSGGDLHITWIRRTRIGGDSWEVAEVPLAEEREAYEVDILDGAGVRRTLAATTPGTTYTAAQQTADWGSPQSAYTIAVHQLSAIYGRGTARQATV